MKKFMKVFLSMIMIVGIVGVGIYGFIYPETFDFLLKKDAVTTPNEETPNEPAPTPVYTVTFETNGGGSFDPQSVESSKTATHPGVPVREGYAFVGWYTTDTYEELFDFSKPITGSCAVYARWLDLNDELDTDGDGVTDAVEAVYGTAPDNVDTDGDGLNDYVELVLLNLDPTKADTDGDGVNDGDEDIDGDALSNVTEIALGTDPMQTDSDADGLDDGKEVNEYGTNPALADSDADGASDSWEIANGFDPNAADTSFNVTVSAPNTENEQVTASVQVQTSGSKAASLKVEKVSENDKLLNTNVPGYLGAAYDFSVEGEIESALITFEYDLSLGTISNSFQPRIYQLNESAGLLVELSGQSVENGRVSATVNSFSTCILLNKVEFDKVWESEIKPPDTENDGITGIDIVFVIDSSGSMYDNDYNNIRLSAVKQFIDKLGENDRGAVVDFDSYAYVYQNFTNDKTLLTNAVNRVDRSGGTSLSAGMNAAINLFTSSSYTRTDAYKIIVFLTDGDGSYSPTYTTMAAQNDIVVYTIGLSRYVQEDVLRGIANGTNGKYYFASTATVLLDIYDDVSFETIDYTTDSNNDGICDYYTKLIYDGILVLGNGSRQFAGIDFSQNADYDGDGLLNGEELIVTLVGNVVYMDMVSDPTVKNTDNDRFDDADDAHPQAWDVTDRDLAMFAQIVYQDIPVGTLISSLESTYPEMAEKIMAKLNASDDHDVNTVAATLAELTGWRVLATSYGSGMQAAAFINGREIVIAFRGSETESGILEGINDWLVADFLGWYTGHNVQVAPAKAFVEAVMNANPDCNFYITGHSLGGNLAYNAGARALSINAAAVKKINVYNGLGLLSGKTLGAFEICDLAILLANQDIITAYRVDVDPVSVIPNTTHVGTVVVVDKCDEMGGFLPSHALHSFLDQKLTLDNPNGEEIVPAPEAPAPEEPAPEEPAPEDAA